MYFNKVSVVLLVAFFGCVWAGHAPAHSYAHLKQEHHVQHGHAGHGGSEGHYDHGHQEEEHHGPINYKFGYAVKDLHTGDDKEAWEHRSGDDVHGSYSLVEPDGSKRTVDYTANKHLGFSAVVKTTGHHGSHVEHFPSQDHHY